MKSKESELAMSCTLDVEEYIEDSEGEDEYLSNN